MTSDLHLEGPTVTLFGHHDALDQALSDELGRRGCSTHTVTIPVGWLTSASHAVIRIDTPTGERAMTDLCAQQARASTIVAVCETQSDELARRRLDGLCRQCGDHHGVSLIWHPPLASLDGGAAVPAAALAVAIADEVGVAAAWTAAPSFATQTFPSGTRHSRP